MIIKRDIIVQSGRYLIVSAQPGPPEAIGTESWAPGARIVPRRAGEQSTIFEIDSFADFCSIHPVSPIPGPRTALQVVPGQARPGAPVELAISQQFNLRQNWLFVQNGDNLYTIQTTEGLPLVLTKVGRAFENQPIIVAPREPGNPAQLWRLVRIDID
ncbi:hypothetical protein AA313_de0204229 [Arthrobotrys entomopaga]|nr:hypothetical protein AA313_de0204229 [Arthrobotrys entomopaga]